MKAEAHTASNAAERLRETGRDVKNSLYDAGSEAAETAKRAVSEIGEIGKDVVNDYAAQGKKQVSTAEDYIREHPVKSVLLGALAGIVVSKLLRI